MIMKAMPSQGKRISQVNLYLDTLEEDAQKMGFSIRLRVTEQNAVITIKSRIKSASKGLFVADEIESEVPKELAIGWLLGKNLLPIPDGKEFDILHKLVPLGLKVATWSRTFRYSFHLGSDMKVELDETMYGDGTRDYEIEIESDNINQAMKIANELSKKLNINLEPQTKTKHARANDHKGPLPNTILFDPSSDF